MLRQTEIRFSITVTATVNSRRFRKVQEDVVASALESATQEITRLSLEHTEALLAQERADDAAPS